MGSEGTGTTASPNVTWGRAHVLSGSSGTGPPASPLAPLPAGGGGASPFATEGVQTLGGGGGGREPRSRRGSNLGLTLTRELSLAPERTLMHSTSSNLAGGGAAPALTAAPSGPFSSQHQPQSRSALSRSTVGTVPSPRPTPSPGGPASSSTAGGGGVSGLVLGTPAAAAAAPMEPAGHEAPLPTLAALMSPPPQLDGGAFSPAAASGRHVAGGGGLVGGEAGGAGAGGPGRWFMLDPPSEGGESAEAAEDEFVGGFSRGSGEGEERGLGGVSGGRASGSGGGGTESGGSGGRQPPSPHPAARVVTEDQQEEQRQEEQRVQVSSGGVTVTECVGLRPPDDGDVVLAAHRADDATWKHNAPWCAQDEELLQWASQLPLLEGGGSSAQQHDVDVLSSGTTTVASLGAGTSAPFSRATSVYTIHLPQQHRAGSGGAGSTAAVSGSVERSSGAALSHSAAGTAAAVAGDAAVPAADVAVPPSVSLEELLPVEYSERAVSRVGDMLSPSPQQGEGPLATGRAGGSGGAAIQLTPAHSVDSGGAGGAASSAAAAAATAGAALVGGGEAGGVSVLEALRGRRGSAPAAVRLGRAAPLVPPVREEDEGEAEEERAGEEWRVAGSGGCQSAPHAVFPPSHTSSLRGLQRRARGSRRRLEEQGGGGPGGAGGSGGGGGSEGVATGSAGRGSVDGVGTAEEGGPPRGGERAGGVVAEGAAGSGAERGGVGEVVEEEARPVVQLRGRYLAVLGRCALAALLETGLGQPALPARAQSLTCRLRAAPPRSVLASRESCEQASRLSLTPAQPATTCAVEVAAAATEEARGGAPMWQLPSAVLEDPVCVRVRWRVLGHAMERA